jgi:predicted TPR repeat methyltransferase
MVSLLPSRRFRRALDLGCGLGLFSRRLADCADTVVGVDVAPSAIKRARVLYADQSNIVFEAHDLLDLPQSFDGSFDLVVVADVLYYLSPDDALLEAIARRIAALLTPDGICLLVNHYFFRFDRESRRSRRIYDAFSLSLGFAVQRQYRRPFYLVTLLDGVRGDH